MMTALTKALECMACLSTAHVPQHTGDALSNKGPLFDELSYVDYNGWGWIIPVNAEQGLAARSTGHPELADLINLCLSQNIGYLRLDCDADRIEGLPTFDW